MTNLKEENSKLRESVETLQRENADLKEEIAARDVEIAELKGDALYGKIIVYSNVILYRGSQEKVIVSQETHSQLFYCCYSVLMNY